MRLPKRLYPFTPFGWVLVAQSVAWFGLALFLALQ